LHYKPYNILFTEIHGVESIEDLVEENIAIVTFGKNTTILHHLTNNGVSLKSVLGITLCLCLQY